MPQTIINSLDMDAEKERILENAKNYHDLNHFSGTKDYKIAHKNGWIGELKKFYFNQAFSNTQNGRIFLVFINSDEYHKACTKFTNKYIKELNKKKEILKQNGWYQHWSEDNWRKVGVEYTYLNEKGSNTDQAYAEYLNDFK